MPGQEPENPAGRGSRPRRTGVKEHEEWSVCFLLCEGNYWRRMSMTRCSSSKIIEIGRLTEDKNFECDWPDACYFPAPHDLRWLDESNTSSFFCCVCRMYEHTAAGISRISSSNSAIIQVINIHDDEIHLQFLAICRAACRCILLHIDSAAIRHAAYRCKSLYKFYRSQRAAQLKWK
jgi:hypothetical protein